MSRRGNGRAIGCLVLVFILLAVVGIGGFLWMQQRLGRGPVPGQQRCVATANDHSVAISLDQAHYASIIVGISVARGLPPRAASIALATVYQETGIRNLDYGDRDSVGLFQQRPSQGWGTAEQLMDPFYATNKFYDALIKIDDWETGDINDVAQKVQISGHPDAYRDHEADARTLASALTGNSPGGFSCLERQHTAGDGPGLIDDLDKTFGDVGARLDGKVVTIKADDAILAWTYAHYAIANSQHFGVAAAHVADRSWSSGDYALPRWEGASPALGKSTVTLTLR